MNVWTFPKICAFAIFYFHIINLNAQAYNEQAFNERYTLNREKRDFVTIKNDFIEALNNPSLTNEQKIRLYIHYATFCKDITQYQIGLNYLDKAYDDLGGKNIPQYAQEIYQNKAYIFFDWFKLNSEDPIDKIRSDSAKYYVDKLMKDHTTLPEFEMIFINNIRAHYEYEAAHYTKAEQIFDANIISQKQYTPCELPLTYVKKMRLYNKTNDTIKLNQAYENSLKAIASCNTSNYLVHTYTTMYEIQNERKNHKKALQNYRLATQVKDSLADNVKMTKIDELDKKYQSQLKDEIISSQRQKETLFVVIMLILGLGLTIYYFAFRKNKKLSLLLEKNNETIEKSLKEKVQLVKDKELMIKEVHHRVKNNFQIMSSLLELQSKDIEDQKALALANEGQNRVKSMALIHQKLYQNEDGLINFDEYLHSLIKELSGLYASDKTVETTIVSKNVKLDVDTAIPLGLIVNELITNAYKYAFDKTRNNQLHISLDQIIENEYKLIVADNGPGLNKNIDLSKVKSLGLRLIRRLTKQLHGSLIQDNKNGAVFEIIFKDTNARMRVN